MELSDILTIGHFSETSDLSLTCFPNVLLDIRSLLNSFSKLEK